MTFKKFMSTISFKPKHVTKRITSHLGDRTRDVIMNRYGLTADAKRKTLEEIGQKYGITRERVRQIENVAFNLIKKSSIIILKFSSTIPKSFIFFPIKSLSSIIYNKIIYDYCLIVSIFCLRIKCISIICSGIKIWIH